MPETIEELLIRIGADVADLKKGMADAGKSVQGLEKTTKDSNKGMDQSFSQTASHIASRVASMRVALLGGAAAFAAAGAAVKMFADHAADSLNALSDLSARTGIAVRELDALRQVAAQSGVSFDLLQQAVAGWAQKTQELADPMSATSLALRAMGVSARDAQGNLRTFADILPDLAGRFAAYRDGVAKAQLAAALFGEEAGPRMLAMLNQGRAAIEAQTASARGNSVASEEAAKLAQQYRVAQTQASEAVSKLAVELGIRLLPVMTQAANVITTLLSLLPRTATAAENLASRIEFLTQKNEQDRAALERLRETLKGMSGDSRKTREGMIADSAARLAANERELQSLLRIQELQRNAAPMPPAPPGQTGTAPPDVGALTAGAQAALAEHQANLALFQEQIFGVRTAIFSMGEAWSTTAQGIMGWTQQLNTSWVSHADIMRQATEYINAAYTTQAERRRALVQFELQLNRMQQQGMFDTANLAANLITQMWPREKNAAIASAVINTATGVTKALASGSPPWNLAQAALVAAAGAVQIRTIRSTSNAGAGGSISVPSTTVPAVPAAASGSQGGGAAAPGSAAPATAAAAPQTAPPGWALTVKGIDPGALFTGRMVDDIIDRINDAVQNGATLISTRNLRF